MKKSIRNQLYFFRFCLKTAPKLFGFHLFTCVEIELFIFFEYTVWIGYNLYAAEYKTPFIQVTVLTIGVFLLFLVHQLIDSAYFHWAYERVKPVLTQKLRGQIYEKAQSMDLSCYDDADFYNDFILSTTQTDQCVERFMEDSQNLIRQFCQALLQASFLIAADRIGLAVAVFCCIIKYTSSKAYYRTLEKNNLEKIPVERERDYQHRVFYLHDYAKELRLNSGMNALLMKDFDGCNDRLNAINRKYGLQLWLYGFLKSYLPVYFIVYTLYLPYLLKLVVLDGTLPISMLVVLLSSVRRMVNRSSHVVELFPKLALNSTFIAKIRSFLSYEPQIQDGPDTAEDTWERLTLSHVSFSYPKAAPGQEEHPGKAAANAQAHEILHDINLEIRRGQKIALVGYNGAGKTTLVKLLMRLYDPDGGIILRNGKDIRNLKLSDYRGEIGAVFQDYKIYAASIRENVVMDCCAMDQKETFEVEQALFAAKFNLTAHKLKYQIETPLTTEFEKDGVDLSGGQSQKVAIARTLYRHQDLIIMDEPSSALDPSAEYQLNQELSEIAKDKTVIFISHRLAAARDADRIYMMKQGRIVEQGTHEQLLSLGGEYSKMWQLQAGGYQ